MASSFALFISACIYGAIFAYLYWARYVNIDRKLDLKRYLNEIYEDGLNKGKGREKIFINLENFQDRVRCLGRARLLEICEQLHISDSVINKSKYIYIYQ